MLKTGFRLAPALLLVLSSSLPSFADAAGDIGQRLRDNRAVSQDGGVEVLALSDETIVSLETDGRATEDTLRRQAQEVVKVVAASDTRRGKPLKVLFIDKNNRASVQEISLNGDQVNAGTSTVQMAFGHGQRAYISSAPGFMPTGAATAGGGAGPMSQAQLQSERTRMVTRIQALQSKGVGVKPFYDEMNKVDDYFKRAELGPATDTLRRLDNVLGEQERVQKARITANQPAAAAPMPARPHAQPIAPSSAGWTGLDISQNMTADAAHEEIARHMLQMELGDLAPSEGPFRLERFRIAEQIKKFQSQGARVDGLKTFYRRMDDLAVASIRDPKRMSELRDDVIYLQKQVGLGELQGNSHYRD